MIGSMSAGLAWWTPSLSAIEAAILNESSFGVDRVEGPVVERGLEVGQRIARDDALGGGLADALLDAREEALRDGAADDPLGELDAAVRVRLELQPDVAEHPVAAGLLLVPAVDLGRAPDGLLVRDPGRVRRHGGPELALEALHDHGVVRLAHGHAGPARRVACARAGRSAPPPASAGGPDPSCRGPAWTRARSPRRATVPGTRARGRVSHAPSSRACRRSR